MGFLGGLFEKKNCDVCGNKIGLLGNRKLEDGNLCKDCAAKLSPWFSERRHSTLAEIKQQLQYREENKNAVTLFNTTRTFGKYYKIYLDDNARKFMVTNSGRIAEANPDVLDFAQITGCDLDINESRSELKQKNAEGKQVSYDPPRYEYSYNFYCTIRVNAPYFDDMRFLLNTGSVRTGEQAMTQAYSGWNIRAAQTGAGFRNSGVNEYYEYLNMGNEIRQALEEARMQGQNRQVQPAGNTAAAEAEAAIAAAAAAASGSGGIDDPELAARIAKMKAFQELTPEQQRAYYEEQLRKAQEAAAKAQGLQAAAVAEGGAEAVMAGGAAAAAAMAAPSQVKCPWCGSMTSSASGKCQFCEGELD